MDAGPVFRKSPQGKKIPVIALKIPPRIFWMQSASTCMNVEAPTESVNA